MDVTFKYEIGQLVYYNNHLYRVLSRAYFEKEREVKDPENYYKNKELVKLFWKLEKQLYREEMIK